jgi:hypothetical protein
MRLEMVHVPVLVAANWSPAQIRAYRLADNRLGETATWDDKLLAIELGAIIETVEVNIESIGWDTAAVDIFIDDDVPKKELDPADEQFAPPKIAVSRVAPEPSRSCLIGSR